VGYQLQSGTPKYIDQHSRAKSCPVPIAPPVFDMPEVRKGFDESNTSNAKDDDEESWPDLKEAREKKKLDDKEFDMVVAAASKGTGDENQSGAHAEDPTAGEQGPTGPDVEMSHGRLGEKEEARIQELNEEKEVENKMDLDMEEKEEKVSPLRHNPPRNTVKRNLNAEASGSTGGAAAGGAAKRVKKYSKGSKPVSKGNQ
jgi:hypothetical protein